MSVSITQKVPWWKLTKFILTGGVALAIDVAIYYALTRYGGIYYLLARTFSLSVAILWNFSINRYWTFQATEGKVSRQALRFILVILSTSLLSLGMMKVGVSILHFHDLSVLLVVSAITTLINFSAHSLWSYKKENSGPSANVPPMG